MAGGTFSVRMTNNIPTRQQEIRRNVTGLGRTMAQIAVRMLQGTMRNFREGGRRNGASGQWKRLSKVTVAMRPKGQRANPRILVRRAILRNSNVAGSTPTTAVNGTTVPYASTHQQGGRWGGYVRVTEERHVPAHRRQTWVSPIADLVARARGTRLTIPKGTLSARQASRLTRVVARSVVRVTGVRARRARAATSTGAGGARAGLVKRAVLVRAHIERRSNLVPARPFLVFQPDELRTYNAMLRRAILKQARAA